MTAPSGAGAVTLHPWMIVFLLLMVHSCGQVINIPPQDTTVFPNMTGMFSCDASGGDFIVWRVNGTSFSDLPNETQSDLDINPVGIVSSGLSTLDIIAKAVYNGTTVQCVTGDIGGAVVKSEIVTLIIQGLLSSVVNLETASSTSSITVSWSAPFSLDVTGVDPDIWYSVLIYNVTDEENPTAFPCTDCHNLTQTHYIFSPHYPSPCHKYTFTVIPYNGVGQGESSQNVTGYTIDNLPPGVSLKKTGIEIDDDHSGQCRVQFNVSGDVDSVCSYTLHDDNDPTISVESSLEDGDLVYFTLPTDRRYSPFFEVSNAAGTWNIPGTNFTTFDVQTATVEGGSEIEITVNFISNSLAMGCLVVLQSDSGSPDEFRVLLRSGSDLTVTDMISVPPSTYTLYVYDLEEDGHVNREPAILPEDRIQVTTKYSSSTSTSKFLTRAELSITGSEVTIRCEFTDNYPEASCVLVYREYNDPYLTVEEYDRSTEFPVTISVDNTERYTFAVFGKNGTDGIEKEPVITLNEDQPPPPPTKSPGGGVIIGIVIAGCLIVLAAATGIVLVIVWIVKRAHQKNNPTVEGVGLAMEEVVNGPVQTVPGDEEKSKYASVVTSPLGMLPPIKDDPTVQYQTIDHKATKVVGGGVREGVKEESKYASVVTSSLGIQPSIKEDQSVQYQTIDHKATKRAAHPHGLLYAELGPPPSQNKAIKNRIVLEEPRTPYAIVLPQTTDATNSEDKGREAAPQPQVKKSRVPLSVEDVMKLLYSVAVRWRDIAEGLGFVEDHIDQIYTNNETDVGCLQDVMEQWMRLGPTWKKLAQVLSAIGEDSLAQQAGGDSECWA